MSLRIAPNLLPLPDRDLSADSETAKLVLAGGCFWCTEAVFTSLKGVLSVTPGYTGGSAETANYDAVCSGKTGHAEALEITYHPAEITYGRLLKIFFAVAHDPTQLNRQGADIGTQYRSAIFYTNEAEQQVAASYIQQLNHAAVFDMPIATTLEPLQTFYPAEEYHHQYAARNPNQPYICSVSDPKVKKLKTYFSDDLQSAQTSLL